MTARELREHLRVAHGIVTRGLPWDSMAAVHDDDHDVGGCGHTHDDERPGAAPPSATGGAVPGNGKVRHDGH